jgi:clan AA aspartic protease
MGLVMTKLKLTNLVDLENARSGLIPPEAVRVQEVNAMVDTGAITLVLPADVVAALGLPKSHRERARLADGTVRELDIVTGLRIEILGRFMACDAYVTPVGSTPLIGQIPLEGLDLVVNPRSREITTNPAHPDGPLFDLLTAS